VAALALAVAAARPAAADPVEPVYADAFFIRISSPSQQMVFTEGLPFRMFADGADPNGWQYLNMRDTPAEVRFFIDGQMVGVAQQTTAIDYYEVQLPAGLAAGPHSLTAQSLNYNNVVLDSVVAVSITVAPMPAHANTVTLTQDLMLSGSTALDWTDTTVIGNGHHVVSATDWNGDIHISNAFVTGLGDYMTPGMTLHTTSGAVTVESSIFEATGAIGITTDGAAAMSIKNNELRANNLLTFVTSDPDVPNMLTLQGSNSGSKVFAGNRVGAGMVMIQGMDGWLIGGDDDSASNVFIGPRAVMYLNSSSKATIRGNYFHHVYNSGWSQGYCLRFFNGSDGNLVEHNVTRDSSWPVQSFGGDFRYNLVVKSGHDWFRTLMPGAQIHRNVVIHPDGPDGAFNGGLLLYQNEASIDVYHNTFDGGGDVGQYNGPVMEMDGSAMASSFRDNVVMNFDKSAAFVNGTGQHLGTADYNCFYNPRTPNNPRYAPGITANQAGAHDVQQDCQLGAGNEIPYSRPEGDIWRGNYKVSQVLAYYRDRFTPQAGSPVIDAADDTGGDIGAIEAPSGMQRPDDQFGKFGQARTDTTAPTVTLTAPTAGSTLHGPVEMQAQASDNVGVTIVQFLSGAGVLGETATQPYTLTIDSCVLGNGTRALSARAWDAAGNSTTSAPANVTVMNDVNCVPMSTGMDGGGDTGTNSSSGSGTDSGGSSGADASSEAGTGPAGSGAKGCSCRVGADAGSAWSALALALVGLGMGGRQIARRSSDPRTADRR
jgi:MYXO-CTERM domain-containing protein